MGESTSQCDHIYESWPVYTIPGRDEPTGAIVVVVGLIYIVNSFIILYWIKKQEAAAKLGDHQAVKSVIFPVFVDFMWVNAAVSLYAGLVFMLVTEPTDQDESMGESFMYASFNSLQHCVTDGLAYMLLQKGMGRNTQLKVIHRSLWWGVVCLFVRFMTYKYRETSLYAVLIAWYAVMFLAYWAIAVVPEKHLYRRPAATFFARFWVVYTTISLLSSIMVNFPSTKVVGQCSLNIVPYFLFALFQPILLYCTLIKDSMWWQGQFGTHDDEEGGMDSGGSGGLEGSGDRNVSKDIVSPLQGLNVNLHSAQSLADAVDRMITEKGVRLLNFSYIELDDSSLLGQGSFSKVYRGTYKRQECAIKLIFTFDLTVDVIRRVAAEAQILAAVKHPNIIYTFGVAVLPPSICIMLELCAYGSLSDVLRGRLDDDEMGQQPLPLSYADLLYIALGCARGLAVIHRLGSGIVHRDIKSFNFLIDSQLNAKLADLELGGVSMLTADSKTAKKGKRQPARSGSGRLGDVWSFFSDCCGCSLCHRADCGANKESTHGSHGIPPSPKPGKSGNMSNSTRSDLSKSSIAAHDALRASFSASGGTGAGGMVDVERASYATRMSEIDSAALDSPPTAPGIPLGFTTSQVVVLPNWMAPEALVSMNYYTQASDVFSFAVVLWEIITKKIPYEGVDKAEVINSILTGKRLDLVPCAECVVVPPEATPGVIVSGKCDPRLEVLVMSMWEHNGANRPNMQDVTSKLEELWEGQCLDALQATSQAVDLTPFKAYNQQIRGLLGTKRNSLMQQKSGLSTRSTVAASIWDAAAGSRGPSEVSLDGSLDAAQNFRSGGTRDSLRVGDADAVQSRARTTLLVASKQMQSTVDAIAADPAVVALGSSRGDKMFAIVGSAAPHHVLYASRPWYEHFGCDSASLIGQHANSVKGLSLSGVENASDLSPEHEFEVAMELFTQLAAPAEIAKFKSGGLQNCAQSMAKVNVRTEFSNSLQLNASTHAQLELWNKQTEFRALYSLHAYPVRCDGSTVDSARGSSSCSVSGNNSEQSSCNTSPGPDANGNPSAAPVAAASKQSNMRRVSNLLLPAFGGSHTSGSRASGHLMVVFFNVIEVLDDPMGGSAPGTATMSPLGHGNDGGVGGARTVSGSEDLEEGGMRMNNMIASR